MLVFKNKKLISCNISEYNQIYNIYYSSDCMEAATKTLYEKLYEKKLNYESNSLYDNLYLMAFNALQAVIKKYKYLKIEGVRK